MSAAVLNAQIDAFQLPVTPGGLAMGGLFERSEALKQVVKRFPLHHGVREPDILSHPF
jgi:hypothetical protein